MNAHDFIYDNIALSTMGYRLCTIDSDSGGTVANGSQITFNTVSTRHGSKWESVGADYGSYLEATFQICKDPCGNDDYEISVADERAIACWLNRKEYHEMHFVDGDYADYYFDASFNIGKVEYSGKIIGLELTMFTNKPYPYTKETQTVSLTANTATNVNVKTDDEGIMFPDEVVITCNGGGTLKITNNVTGRYLQIDNCSSGEVITMNYPVITSSSSSHDIPNDFNWSFFSLYKAYGSNTNSVTSTLPCTVVISYKSAAKINI